MKASEIRQKFLEFFAERGHAVIPSASLVPEHDPTVLFTTAGMHPLVPYLLGEPHPAGKRLADAQKCLRTDDIAEVGDERHLTFFEMLGNWSLGDYFKHEAIQWSFEFLTDKKWLGLDPRRLYVTVFAGDTDAPFDDESAEIWKEQFAKRGIEAELGKPGKDEPEDTRIFAYGKEKNWWGPVGQSGPCGPDTEMFYEVWDPVSAAPNPHTPKFGPKCHPNCDCGRFVEIWNDVFMQYEKIADGTYHPLAQKNVDTGMGLERIVAVVQSAVSVFETDLFTPIIKKIEDLSGKRYGSEAEVTKAMRIMADHVRAATFVLGDPWGVAPSNKDQGYIVRRLIRRAIVQAALLGITKPFTPALGEVVIVEYGGFYGELRKGREKILAEVAAEEEKFRLTLERGMKLVTRLAERGSAVSGDEAFELYATYGFPIELTRELLAVRTGGKVRIQEQGFAREFAKHQEISRAGSAAKFAGGLADHSQETVRGHTATHLLHQALRIVLGSHVEQKGSNITHERLRFDFSHSQKMTPEEIKAVETLVAEQIRKDLPVTSQVLTVSEAKSSGALGFFEDKYAQLGDKIKVYFVGDEKRGFFSKEICGGPHVEHTGDLGEFKIIKEEAVSAGVRRIKATVSGPAL
ncbi:MAG: alanine--tRNA ligase [Patescibacteria group bacterium]